MSENLKLARLYLLILAIVTVGRWALGFRGVPYERGTSVFSIVIMTLFASIFYAAFTRRWLDYRVLQAVGLTVSLGLVSQLVILLSTAASYALGIDSYFNHPVALNQPGPVGFGEAMAIRGGGLVVNTILNGIAGALGWAMGAALPQSPR
ncbi:MAG TPA: hypothetical protein VGB42_12680 [Candidatus Thermoplasmatota archaeon]